MQVEDIQNARVVFLYTEIGRGHPSYLDGIVEALSKNYPDNPYFVTDVFKSSQSLSRTSWKVIRWLYEFGSRGGIITSGYSMLRRTLGSRSRDGNTVGLLGRDLKKQMASFSGIIVVAHPLLARMLRDQNEVIYQHGEFAVPNEAVVPGCYRILAPADQTTELFVVQKIPPEIMIATGSCIDPRLAAGAKAAFDLRLDRLTNTHHYQAALFSSGAAPRIHIRQICVLAEYLIARGHAAHIYSGQSDRMFSLSCKYFDRRNIAFGTNPDGSEQLVIIPPSNRREQDRVFSASFESYDFFVAPAHERVHFALALGLPQFMLTPHIGTFSPLNAETARVAGVGLELPYVATEKDITDFLSVNMTNTKLTDMARRGYGRLPVDGFDRCAEAINSLTLPGWQRGV